MIVDIDEGLAGEVVDAIESAGGAAEFRAADVANVAAVAALAEDIASAHGRIDVLVNSAGVAHRSPIESFSEEAYDRILALNLKGTYFMSQSAGKQMLGRAREASSTSPRSAASSPTPTRAPTSRARAASSS